MTSLAERVAAGAAVLDSKRPGWAREIDLARLDLYNGNHCILGQLAEKMPAKNGNGHCSVGYLHGLHQFDLPASGAQDLGFYPIDVGIRCDAEAECRELDRIWIVQIMKRLSP